VMGHCDLDEDCCQHDCDDDCQFAELEENKKTIQMLIVQDLKDVTLKMENVYVI
jgi:hypothetical protein